MSTLNKLKILAESAKYDVSCASSGANKKNKGGLGNSLTAGICHAWSSDGRCISLLKILLTNNCIYDCKYCINRRSNDIPRASFTPAQVASLTIEFYRRNYIEGLFLSSAVERSPDETMTRLHHSIWLLRHQYQFHGYIHVKIIPGASPDLIYQTGLLADRLSVNLELPTVDSLQLLAPQKKMPLLLKPMYDISRNITVHQAEQRRSRHAKSFVPAGQSTQFIIGASPDSDYDLLRATEQLYQRYQLKRVYFSAYVPVNEDNLLPAVTTQPPLNREHRLYQADWLLRFYNFKAEELLDTQNPFLDPEFDPKLCWALRHIEHFPIEINRAPLKQLVRIPGIGLKTARRIIQQRRLGPVQYDHLKKMRVVLKRAQYFITCQGKYYGRVNVDPLAIRQALIAKPAYQQLSIFNSKASKH